MRAMILAAGLGKRLRPLTNDRPKALVEVAGKTLLEIALLRLASFGIREIIVNVHHFADMVAEYLRQNENFGMRIEISREDVLLDTGGGLKKAGWFFLEDENQGQPFLVHNVDVISSIDVVRMVQAHREGKFLASLAVQQRKTSRHLLFDDQGRLCGRRTGDHAPELVHTVDKPQAFAFSGVHVISPRLLPIITEEGVFSIIQTYLRLAEKGESIAAFRADQYYWRDAGKPENVSAAEQDIQKGLI